MTPQLRLFTGAWHGDREVILPVPRNWEVTVFSPDTPAPLTDSAIAQALLCPVGQAPIRELCRGKLRPVVIVDDLNRPTPVDRILPFVLNEFRAGGIQPEKVRILLATGTHSQPTPDAAARKVGLEPAALCQVLVHDSKQNCHKIGTTSRGTPVVVNGEVLASDFVIGAGGIYPNHTAGFGGGSKLAVGVLGIRSVLHLHYRHHGVGWGSLDGPNTFRSDLDEIAELIGLRTSITVHVNARRQAVRLACGDHLRYFPGELAFVRQAFRVPPPGHADVIISNAYPNDVSVTFARMKGMAPFRAAVPGASRIVVASCHDGMGRHALFPLKPSNPVAHALRILPAVGARGLLNKLPRYLLRRSKRSHVEQSGAHPVWLYCPYQGAGLPKTVPGGIRISESWPEVLRAVETEQAGKQRLRAMVYPCAPLQFIDATAVGTIPAESANLEFAFH